MIQNKIFLIVFLCFFANLFSQEAISSTLKKDTIFTEKDVLFDTSDTLSKLLYENRFQQKYKNSDFNYIESKPGQSFFQRFINWLSRRIASLFEVSNPSKTKNYASNFIKFLALIIILIAVYFIFKIILNKEGNWIFGKSSNNKIAYNAIEENLQSIDFSILISQTNKSGNNRLEIRYYYLWVLKKLTEKEIIIFHPEKTNSDYYNEIKSGKTKDDFKYVSYLYTYIWYGEFEISTETYESSKASFVKMLQTL